MHIHVDRNRKIISALGLSVHNEQWQKKIDEIGEVYLNEGDEKKVSIIKAYSHKYTFEFV